jgi:hypothetical protein
MHILLIKSKRKKILDPSACGKKWQETREKKMHAMRGSKDLYSKVPFALLYFEQILNIMT